MPVMPGGNFVPQSVLQGGTGQTVMPKAMGTGTPNPAAGANAQQMAGPGQGGAATAQTAEAQLPAAQQAAGMQPAQPQQGQAAPPQPGQPPAQPPAPPVPQPGFVPNSQGQQVYMPGQGPVTEKVPPLADMANQPVAAEPRGHMDMPLDANAQAGQMELMANNQSEETDPFDLLGQMFEEFYDRPAHSQKAATVSAGLLSGLPMTGISRLSTENVKTGKAKTAAGRNKASSSRDNAMAGRNKTAAGDGLLAAGLAAGFPNPSGGNKAAFDVSALAARRDPDGISEVPWDKAQRDGAGRREDDDDDEDDDEVEDPSDLEEEEDSTVVFEPKHEAVPYDDNGKPRPSWKESMDRMSQLAKGREYTPGEDCAYCGVTFEKGDGGQCNRCGHNYDTGEKMAEQMWCARCHEKWEDCHCPGKDKVATVIGTHGVPMVSTSGDMQRTSAGEGDVSSLLVAPWSQNGADAWRDLHQHQGRSGGKGKTTFGGLLSTALDTMSGMNPPKQAEKRAMNDCYANAYDCGEGCECAKAKKEKAAFEILPDGSTRLTAEDMEIFSSGGNIRITKSAAVHPFRPINADPDFIAANQEWHDAEKAKIAARRASPFAWGSGDPVVTGFLRSMGCSVDANGQIKSAMIGDDGSTTADPFGGGMILGQQQPAEDPMDNPGTLLEAGLGDDTTAQPSDHGQHDATVAPFSNGIDVNVFKEGSFGWGFVQQCQAQGLSPEFTYLAATKSAEISDAIAEELEPLTKQAFLGLLGGGAKGLGPKLMQGAKGLWTWGAKAPNPNATANAVRKIWPNAVPPAAAQPAASATAKYLPTFKPAIDAFNAGGATQKALVARTAIGAGAGGARDLYDYSQGREYQGYAPTYAGVGAGSALLGVPGLKKMWTGSGPRIGLLGAAERAMVRNPMMRNYVTAPTYGALSGSGSGYGAGWLADTAIEGMTGEDPGLRNYGAMLGGGYGGLSRSPWGRAALGRMGTTGRSMSNMFAAGAPGGLAAAGNYADMAPIIGAPIVAAGQRQGAQATMSTVAQTMGVPTTDAQGNPLNTLQIGAAVREAMPGKAMEMVGQDPRVQQLAQQFGAVGPDGQVDFDKLIQAAESNGQVFQQIQQAMASNPDLMKKLQSSGLLATDEQGNVNLQASMDNVSKTLDRFQQFKDDPLGQIMGSVGEWFKSIGPVGQMLMAGGVLALLGGLMGGGSGMGLLGAGALAMGAMGYGDQIAGMLGFGGQQQQQSGETPAEPPLTVGPPPDQSLGTPTPPVSPAAAGKGEAPPQGFDAGAALQNLLPQVQQILPDVTTEEIMGMMTQLGENADQVFDMQPAELAATIQALRQRGG